METNASAALFNASSDSSQEDDQILPYVHRILLLCLFSLTATLSLVGNVMVVTVLLVRRRLLKSVRLPLVNLALADILMTIFCIPFNYSQFVHFEWQFPFFLCPIVVFLQEATLIVSMFTLTFMGIDRYLAVLFPMKFRWLRTSKVVVVSLLVIWLLGIGICLAILIFARVVPEPMNGVEMYWCSNEWPTSEWDTGFTITRFIATLVVPIVILTFTYSSIACKLYHHTSPGNVDAERDQRQRQNTFKVMKMLMLIVVLFVIAWFPLQIYLFLSLMGYSTGLDLKTQFVIFLWLYWLAMSSCFVNPFIYCFTNNGVMNDVKLISKKLKNLFRRDNKEKSKQGMAESTITNVSYIFTLSTHC